MSKPFLGVGMAFPVAVEAKTGEFARARYEESVRQSILIILGTAKGERVRRPDFGCGIHDLVFENANNGAAGRIRKDVHDALLLFETRIDVIEVDVRVGEQRNVLLIDIEYEVRATNNVFNLVYPFYLEQSAPA